MDDYYDDDYLDNLESNPDKKIRKTNPKGPYQIEITFRGITYDITIENVTYNKFRVSANTEGLSEEDTEKAEENIRSLEKYLNDEGFYLAAKKWNLYYK